MLAVGDRKKRSNVTYIQTQIGCNRDTVADKNKKSDVTYIQTQISRHHKKPSEQSSNRTTKPPDVDEYPALRFLAA